MSDVGFYLVKHLTQIKSFSFFFTTSIAHNQVSKNIVIVILIMFIFAIIGMQEGPRFEPRESRGLEEYQGFPFGGHLTVIIIFINTATIILSVSVTCR